MASSSLQKASQSRRSTGSSKTATRHAMPRSSAIDSRKAIGTSSNCAGLNESLALKQAAAQACTKVGDMASTQPIETEARPPSGNSTSSSKNYISVDEDLQSKLQDRCNFQRERANSSVNGGSKMTPRSPLMQLMDVPQKIPGEGSFRMLLSVTLLGTIWEVRVIVKAQETVKDVIKAALAAYSREGRKLSGGSSEAYELYLSPFSLQYLEMDAKMMDVGARNFVLRRKKEEADFADGNSEVKRWWASLWC